MPIPVHTRTRPFLPRPHLTHAHPHVCTYSDLVMACPTLTDMPIIPYVPTLTCPLWHTPLDSDTHPPFTSDMPVHCCYVHVCFIQVTTCGAPNALRRLGACTFLLLSHLLESQNKYQSESARTKARQCVGSTKQVSKLSLGQNKHGQNITTPYLQPM